MTTITVGWQGRTFRVEALSDGRARWQEQTTPAYLRQQDEARWYVAQNEKIALMEIGAYCRAEAGHAIIGFSHTETP